MEINAQTIMQTLTMTHEITSALTSLVSEKMEVESYVLMMGEDFCADYQREAFFVPYMEIDPETYDPVGEGHEIAISFKEVADRVKEGSGAPRGATLQ